MSGKSISFSIPINAENKDLIFKISVLVGLTQGSGTKTSTDEPEKKSGSVFKTIDDVKDMAKAAKKEFGEKFCQSVLDAHDVDERTSMIRRITAMDECDYGAVYKDLEAGPGKKKTNDDDDDDNESGGGSDDDWGLGDEEPEEAEVSVVALKKALQAIAKEKDDRPALEKIMRKHKCPELSSIKELDASGRAKLMKAVSHL